MNDINGKSEPETVELKKAPHYETKNPQNSNFCRNIIYIILLIVLLAIIFIFFLIYKKICNDFNAKILEKENEIEEYKQKLSGLGAQPQKNQVRKEHLSPIEREYLYDKDFYMSNNMGSKDDLNRLAYKIVLHTHTLEKGLEHFELRPFGKKKIELIINLLKAELKYENHEKDFSFINGINSLREYKKTYEQHKWTNEKEYKIVSEFLEKYKKIGEQRTGAYILTKEELRKDYKIDYKKFIKSRHSTRNYKNEVLKPEDIKEAIEMAKYSPSACNRQYIKVHYYPKGKMRQNVIKYSLGKGGLYMQGVNTFIITFDVNGLDGAGERNQGYFNAGLFATNLVNAFHSLGIGTCFIQFANSVKEEEDLKKLNDIPSHERIAVILYAGYYDEKSIFAVSPRKDFEEYFTEHK
jgi:nitroreductase